MLGTENETLKKRFQFSGGEIFLLLLAMLIFAALSTAGSAYWGAQYGARKALAKISASPLTAVVPRAIPQMLLAAKSISPPPITSASVAGNGEGILDPLARQLTADPSLFSASVCKNRLSAKKKADCNAYVLAVTAGLINTMTGWEMRVKAPNSFRFVIEKNAEGNLQIAEYVASTGTHAIDTASANDLTKIAMFPVAQTVASSHFIGPQDGLPSFHAPGLYMYTG